MSKAYVEIDFFQMEKRKSASSKPSSVERPPSSFRASGIQSVVSRINPQLLKTVMAAGAARCAGPRPREQLPLSSSSSSAPPMEAEEPSQYSPPPPVFNNTASRFSICPAATDTAPLTIFYNGAVTVFDVPRDKAEAIIRMAATGAVGDLAERVEDSFLDGKQLGSDLPMARRKSLQSFLAKRRQRLASVSPYDKVSSFGPYHNMWHCEGHKYA